MPNTTDDQSASIALPKAVIDEIASKLNIKDRSRIPERLAVTTIKEGVAEALGLQKSTGAHVMIIMR